MNTEIEPLLRQFILENLLYSDGPFPVSDGESLLANGLIDSTGIMELVDFVCRQFAIEVPIRDINQENFDSVAVLAAYIRRRSREREIAASLAAAAAVETTSHQDVS